MKAKPDKPPPPVLKLGAGAHYTRLDVLADTMGTTEKGIRTLLATLDLPIAHFPGMADSRYVLTYAFESAIFALGMPKKIKEDADLLRVHQELAGVLYGTLTKEALRERVRLLIKGLTSTENKATIGKKRRRSRDAYRTWPGRTPN
jgi:hypothetical protein